MRKEPLLPPPYRAWRLPATVDARRAAIEAARGGIEEGVFYWVDRSDRLEAALVLTPERPLRALYSTVYVAALGLAGALGSVLPATATVTFAWPNWIEANGGRVGRLLLSLPACEADAVPAWLILGIDLALAGDPADDAPGRNRDSTNLMEEGMEGADATDLLEGFSRHFLVWLRTWEADGFVPVREAWLNRCRAFPSQRPVPLPGDGAGVVLGIDDDGALLVRQDDARRTLAIESALAAAEDWK